MGDMDYYAVLGIQKDATSDGIRKAYRRSALTWHPDKNPDNKEAAEHQFKIISEAYEVLSDPSKRELYNRYGKDGLTNGAPNPSRGQPNGPYPFDVFSPFEFHFKDPMDIFREVFGGPGLDLLFGQNLFMGMDAGRSHNRAHRSASHRNANRQAGSPYQHAAAANRGPTRTDLAVPNNYDPTGGFFDLFGGAMMQPFGLFASPFGGASFSSSSTSSFGNFGGGNFRSVSTSSHIVNGRTVKVTKVVENGTETITEEVDGQITNRTTRPRGGGSIQAM